MEIQLKKTWSVQKEIFVMVLFCFGCTRVAPTPINTPKSDLKQDINKVSENVPLNIDFCRSNAKTGPYWNVLRNKSLAFEERAWIGRIGVSPIPVLDDSPEIFTLRLILLSRLSSSKLSVVGYDEEGRFIVQGFPKDVLEFVKTDCYVGFFDLTGFHCDCNPAMCEKAKQGCALEMVPVLSKGERRESGNGVVGCLVYESDYHDLDPIVSSTRYGRVQTIVDDPRGVFWSSMSRAQMRELVKCSKQEPASSHKHTR